MAAPSDHKDVMLRKPILMPPRMISKVEKIATDRKVSFARVVRDAVAAFEDTPADEDLALLDALADIMIQSTREIVAQIEAVGARLDETHAMLEGS